MVFERKHSKTYHLNDNQIFTGKTDNIESIPPILYSWDEVDPSGIVNKKAFVNVREVSWTCISDICLGKTGVFHLTEDNLIHYQLHTIQHKDDFADSS